MSFIVGKEHRTGFLYLKVHDAIGASYFEFVQFNWNEDISECVHLFSLADGISYQQLMNKTCSEYHLSISGGEHGWPRPPWCVTKSYSIDH